MLGIEYGKFESRFFYSAAPIYRFSVLPLNQHVPGPPQFCPTTRFSPLISETASFRQASPRETGFPLDTVLSPASFPSCAHHGNRFSTKGNLGFPRLAGEKNHLRPPFLALQCSQTVRLEQKLNRFPSPLRFRSQSARPIAAGVQKDLLSFYKKAAAGATCVEAPKTFQQVSSSSLQRVFSLSCFEKRRQGSLFKILLSLSRFFE